MSTRATRKFRIRKKISGSSETPRLTVSKSLKQIYAQLIDDTTGVTLASASSLSKDIESDVKSAKTKTEVAGLVGKLLAKKAKDNKINKAVFDRNGYRYHGRVKALADAAREEGLTI